MINSKFDNFIEDMKNIRMTAEEKADVFSRAFSMIEEIESIHSEALPSSVVASHPVKTTFLSAWQVYFRERKFVPTLIIAGVLFVVGGTSILAEGALPGDSLYTLKVNVNEQVRGLAAVTPVAKARFALEITDQRLKEVALLSSQGRLDESTRQIIEDQLIKQAGQVQNQVASLVATNNVKAAQEVATNFESSLKAHELILQKISNDQASSSTSTPHIASIIDAVQTEIATSTESRISLNTQESLSDSNDKDKVTEHFNDTKKSYADFLVTLGNSSISTSTLVVVSAYSSEINQFVTNAGYFIDKADYPQALTKVQQADQLISDAEAIINADITSSASLKTIVNDALSTATTSIKDTTVITATSTGSTLDASSTVSTATSTASTTSAGN